VVLKTSICLRAKHLKVFYTVVFSETAVLLEYFKNMELPNGGEGRGGKGCSNKYWK
jgi:hypothetical protein